MDGTAEPSAIAEAEGHGLGLLNRCIEGIADCIGRAGDGSVDDTPPVHLDGSVDLPDQGESAILSNHHQHTTLRQNCLNLENQSGMGKSKKLRSTSITQLSWPCAESSLYSSRLCLDSCFTQMVRLETQAVRRCKELQLRFPGSKVAVAPVLSRRTCPPARARWRTLLRMLDPAQAPLQRSQSDYSPWTENDGSQDNSSPAF